MLALYRAGRQAEALDVYRATRRHLVDELGLEPGPALRELEERILRHDPSLAAGPALRPASPAAEPAARSARTPAPSAGASRRWSSWAALLAAGAIAALLAGHDGRRLRRGHRDVADPGDRTAGRDRRATAQRGGTARVARPSGDGSGRGVGDVV